MFAQYFLIRPQSLRPALVEPEKTIGLHYTTMGPVRIIEVLDNGRVCWKAQLVSRRYTIVQIIDVFHARSLAVLCCFGVNNYTELGIGRELITY